MTRGRLLPQDSALSVATAAPAWIARPGTGVGGELRVPGDKSISHRALVLGSIAQGDTAIDGFLRAADCLATLGALRALGVTIDLAAEGAVTVRGAGLLGLQAAARPLDLGNAGTGLRLLAGLLAGQPFDSQLVGDASLMRRPMERVAEPLRRMGAQIETTAGCPPVRIRGGRRLLGIRHEIEVPSAQVKSAILLAGLYARGETELIERSVTRDHTERMLRAFGASVQRSDDAIVLQPGPLTGRSVAVPGDLSSAAFALVAGIVAGRSALVIRDVGVNPTRTGLLDALQLMGGRIDVTDVRQWDGEPVANITVHPGSLRGIALPVDLVARSIDELPVLFVAAALAEGETVVCGAGELRVKESDRLAAMAAGLQALGADLELRPDGMCVRGGRLMGGTVDSHGDHRVAMALAVAAARAAGPVRIRDVANVGTSYPGFVASVRGIGLDLAEESPT